MQTNATFFQGTPSRAVSVYSKSDEVITGKKLLFAILLSFVVMGVAVFLGLHLAAASGLLWLGFLPLSLGWLLLYPIFKKLEG